MYISVLPLLGDYDLACVCLCLFITPKVMNTIFICINAPGGDAFFKWGGGGLLLQIKQF